MQWKWGYKPNVNVKYVNRRGKEKTLLSESVMRDEAAHCETEKKILQTRHQNSVCRQKHRESAHGVKTDQKTLHIQEENKNPFVII